MYEEQECRIKFMCNWHTYEYWHATQTRTHHAAAASFSTWHTRTQVRMRQNHASMQVHCVQREWKCWYTRHLHRSMRGRHLSFRVLIRVKIAVYLFSCPGHLFHVDSATLFRAALEACLASQKNSRNSLGKNFIRKHISNKRVQSTA